MRHSLWLVAMLLALLLSDLPAMRKHKTRPLPARGKNDNESPLRRGSNEFGVWTGYSPSSFKLKGQTEDRKLFLLNLQYARTLFTTCPLTLKVHRRDCAGGAGDASRRKCSWLTGLCWSTPGTVYGAGASPIGFQGNFSRKSIQPFCQRKRGIP